MMVHAKTVALARQILAKHELFSQLRSAELDEVLARARVEAYRAHHEIFSKGSSGTGLFAVLRGNVRISSFGPDGNFVIFDIIGPGSVFGEIALLDGKERTADAAAITDCELLVVDRRDFVPFLRDNPDVALRLLAVLCARLRRTTEQVEDVVLLDAASRLAKKLLRLTKADEPQAAAFLPLNVAVSQRDLGRMIGLSRESINKQLSAWQKDGIIKVEEGTITILDQSALREFAEIS